MKTWRVWWAVLAAIPFLSCTQLSAQMSFKKVEIRTNFGAAQQGDDGWLQVDAESIRFVRDKDRRQSFAIPTSAVTDLFYSRVSGRRIKTAIVVTPLLLFSKGKKHYMTITFNDGADLIGAVEFKLHKSNYRGVLHAVEEVSGVQMKFDQEGIKDEKESISTREGDDSQGMAVIEFSSEPAGAEIEIDGAFAGSTPRTKELQPGEHTIKILKRGFKSWERKIVLEAGEKLPIAVELEPDDSR